jgi:hypothetical protein
VFNASFPSCPILGNTISYSLALLASAPSTKPHQLPRPTLTSEHECLSLMSFTACTPHSILENHRRMAGVATDFPRHHQGLPCLTLLNSAVGPPLKQPFGHRRGVSPTGWAACGCLLPLWTPTPYAYVSARVSGLDTIFDFIQSLRVKPRSPPSDREIPFPTALQVKF